MPFIRQPRGPVVEGIGFSTRHQQVFAMNRNEVVVVLHVHRRIVSKYP